MIRLKDIKNKHKKEVGEEKTTMSKWINDEIQKEEKDKKEKNKTERRN